jgi:hypothetical protein
LREVTGSNEKIASYKRDECSDTNTDSILSEEIRLAYLSEACICGIFCSGGKGIWGIAIFLRQEVKTLLSFKNNKKA